MRLKNKILLITLGSILSISFTACGGGGGSDSSFSNSEELIPISIPCEVTPSNTDISNYITLNSGDVIVKDTDTAEISIYHDINGTKKVCLVTPSAHIIRK